MLGELLVQRDVLGAKAEAVGENAGLELRLVGKASEHRVDIAGAPGDGAVAEHEDVNVVVDLHRRQRQGTKRGREVGSALEQHALHTVDERFATSRVVGVPALRCPAGARVERDDVELLDATGLPGRRLGEDLLEQLHVQAKALGVFGSGCIEHEDGLLFGGLLLAERLDRRAQPDNRMVVVEHGVGAREHICFVAAVGAELKDERAAVGRASGELARDVDAAGRLFVDTGHLADVLAALDVAALGQQREIEGGDFALGQRERVLVAVGDARQGLFVGHQHAHATVCRDREDLGRELVGRDLLHQRRVDLFLDLVFVGFLGGDVLLDPALHQLAPVLLARALGHLVGRRGGDRFVVLAVELVAVSKELRRAAGLTREHRVVGDRRLGREAVAERAFENLVEGVGVDVIDEGSHAEPFDADRDTHLLEHELLAAADVHRRERVGPLFPLPGLGIVGRASVVAAG